MGLVLRQQQAARRDNPRNMRVEGSGVDSFFAYSANPAVPLRNTLIATPPFRRQRISAVEKKRANLHPV
jgi:hypothetical protein